MVANHKMREPFKSKRWLRVRCLLAIGFICGGCRGPEAAYSEISGAAHMRTSCVFQRELVKIYAGSGLHTSAHEQRISEAGTLTLPDIGVVIITNKTVSELQTELTALYRKYYNNLDVWVVPEGAVYYVGGEVKFRGPKKYVGKTTVTRAIQAAGGFTESANKGKMELIRSEGRSKVTVVVDLRKAFDQLNDPPVYPGDRIDVPRKWWR